MLRGAGECGAQAARDGKIIMASNLQAPIMAVIGLGLASSWCASSLPIATGQYESRDL